MFSQRMGSHACTLRSTYAVIVDVDECGPLEAALHSVELVAGVGGEAGAVGLAVEAVVGHALTGSVRIHLQELELAEVGLVEELNIGRNNFLNVIAA